MNKKIGLLLFCTLFLVTALVCVPLTLAQIRWDYCKVDAYGTNLNDYSDSTTNTDSINRCREGRIGSSCSSASESPSA